MLAVFSSNHRQRSGRNLVDGHAIPGSGLLLTTWQTPTLGFRKQERQLRTRSTGGCLRSIAQRTRSGACSYWIGCILFDCKLLNLPHKTVWCLLPQLSLVYLCCDVLYCKVHVFGWLRPRYCGCQSLQLIASLAPQSASLWLHMELGEFSGTSLAW